MLSVPSDVKSYLIPDETILKEWSIGDLNVYATQHRIFLIRKDFLSKNVVEASYDYISSIEFTRERRLGRLVVAILFLIFSFIYPHLVELFNLPLTFDINIIFEVTFLLLGLGLLIWFIFGVDEFFKLHVIGREPPIQIPKVLSDLVRFVREKRP